LLSTNQLTSSHFFATHTYPSYTMSEWRPNWECAWINAQSIPGVAALIGVNVQQEQFVFPQPVDWRPLGANNCRILDHEPGTIFVNATGRAMAAHKFVLDCPLYEDASVLVFHHHSFQQRSLLVRRLNEGSLVLMANVDIEFRQWTGAYQLKCMARNAMTGDDVWTDWYDVDKVIPVSRLVRDIKDHMITGNPRMSANFTIRLVLDGTTDHLDPSRHVWNPRWRNASVPPMRRCLGKQSTMMQTTLHHFFVMRGKCGVVAPTKTRTVITRCKRPLLP
jgi:hypothetical protein